MDWLCLFSGMVGGLIGYVVMERVRRWRMRRIYAREGLLWQTRK
jgi:hypothetical protein